MPAANLCSAANSIFLFAHLIGEGEQLGRHLDAERLGDLEVDDDHPTMRTILSVPSPISFWRPRERLYNPSQLGDDLPVATA